MDHILKTHEGPCETLPPCQCNLLRSKPSLGVAMREDDAFRSPVRFVDFERDQLGLSPGESTQSDERKATLP